MGCSKGVNFPYLTFAHLYFYRSLPWLRVSNLKEKGKPKYTNWGAYQQKL